jgi:hypothetical protein
MSRLLYALAASFFAAFPALDRLICRILSGGRL